jgi:hypothetical protein
MRRTVFITMAIAAFLIAPAVLAQEKSLLESEPTGWTSIMPGTDLKGWSRLPIPATLGVDPRARWSGDAAAGTLICSGKGGHEWLKYEKEYGDFVLHVEWRFTPSPAAEGKYNSGIGIRLSPWGEIWHQAQTGPAGAWLFGVDITGGKLVRTNLRDKMIENRVKPAGEWNVMEVSGEGGTLKIWLNGKVVSEWTGTAVTRGFIGLEAEGFEIAFRNMQIKEK